MENHRKTYKTLGKPWEKLAKQGRERLGRAPLVTALRRREPRPPRRAAAPGARARARGDEGAESAWAGP